MSVWSRLGEIIAHSAAALAGVVEAVRTLFAGDPELRRRVAFSVALIALAAKMAKADGVVSDREVRAFRDIFQVPPHEERNVARLYALAQQDVAGYESYARQMAGLCGSGQPNCTMLEDVLDGLFHIATADGAIHQRELDFLAHVSHIFAIDEEHYAQILSRHVVTGEGDPYAVLGVSRGMPMTEIRRRYRSSCRKTTPTAPSRAACPASSSPSRRGAWRASTMPSR